MTEEKNNNKKTLKSLIRFHSANKINNYNRGGKKKSKRIYRTSQNIRIINVFLESLLSEAFPSLRVTVHFTFLRFPPNYTDLWTCCGVCSNSNLVLLLCSCLQCPQVSELVCFLLWELSVSFHTFHTHRVCLVDCVHLICSFYT